MNNDNDLYVMEQPINTNTLNKMLKDDKWKLVASYLGVNGHKSKMVLVRNAPNLILKGISTISELQLLSS